MSELQHHFPDDVLRGFAIGTSPEASRLAVACHLDFCEACRQGTREHEEVLGQLGRLLAVGNGGRAEDTVGAPDSARARLFAELPAQAPRAVSAPPPPLPLDLPALPGVLVEHLRGLRDPRWRRLIPGIRAIDLGFPRDEVWRARLVAFRPGIPIPEHDHGGPEHTVVFQGGLNDPLRHLERGDAATMLPGETHHQRAADGLPCIALIVNEREPRALSFVGQVLKTLTRS